ncbi:MAG TPA: hypothetical protein VMZ50_06355, partial [Phycisphaerae bacterium]|nr:hypothetical protein [Phycisphaerae bacterium]
MAFGFFRRRQKMVVIIMAVLMISFLIGFQGFQMIFHTNPEDIVLATTSLGELKNGDLRRADSDVQVLRQFVGLGNPQRMLLAPWPTDAEFMILVDQDRPELTLALLEQAAEASHITITQGNVDEFFARIGCPVGGESYEAILSSFKSRAMGTEANLRATVARWLKVYQAYL